MCLGLPGRANAVDTVTATPSTVTAGKTFTIDVPPGPNGRVLFSRRNSTLGKLPDFTSLVFCTVLTSLVVLC
ncbi:hypothetical protein [Streptomyces sp. NPDC002644]